jgi:hypothetical protein
MEKFFEKYKTEIFILGIAIVIFLLVRKKLKNLFETNPQTGIPPGGGQTIPPGGQTIPPGGQTTPPPGGNKDDWAVNDIKPGSKLYAKKNTQVIADVAVPNIIPGAGQTAILTSVQFLERIKNISQFNNKGKIITIQNEAPLGVVQEIIEVKHDGTLIDHYFKLAKLKYDVERYVIFAVNTDGNWKKWYEATNIQLMP